MTLKKTKTKDEVESFSNCTHACMQAQTYNNSGLKIEIKDQQKDAFNKINGKDIFRDFYFE